MNSRLNYYGLSKSLFNNYVTLNDEVKSTLDESLTLLVNIRASQLNGCAFCVDMHIKEATLAGLPPLKIHHLSIWHESSLFSAKERAVLLWTEKLTRLEEKGVSDEVFNEVREHVSEKELVELTYLIIVINGWNRLGIAFKSEPGSADVAYGLDKAFS